MLAECLIVATKLYSPRPQGQQMRCTSTALLDCSDMAIASSFCLHSTTAAIKLKYYFNSAWVNKYISSMLDKNIELCNESESWNQVRSEVLWGWSSLEILSWPLHCHPSCHLSQLCHCLDRVFTSYRMLPPKLTIVQYRPEVITTETKFNGLQYNSWEMSIEINIGLCTGYIYNLQFLSLETIPVIPPGLR